MADKKTTKHAQKEHNVDANVDANVVYYAVQEGRVPGIYTDWKRAEKQLYLYEGSVVRKFNTLLDAEAFMGVDQPFTKEVVACAGKKVGADVVVCVDSTLGDPQTYHLDVSEYKTSHGILEALNDYLEGYLEHHLHVPSVLEIVVGDVRVYNVLHTYLPQWKSNLWMTTRGPVEHKDMMKALYETLREFPAYEVTHNPYHPRYESCTTTIKK